MVLAAEILTLSSLVGKATRLSLIGLVTTLCACGGGSGGSAPPPPAPPPSNPPPPATTTTPVWTLERADPSVVGLTSSEVNAVLDLVFTDAAVQAAMVVKLGRVVGERYAPGHDASSIGTSWSIAKSFYAAAIGHAIDAGLMTLDQPASAFLTEWIGTDRESITVRQLLEMRGGLPANVGTFIQADQTAFALGLDTVNAPGTTFLYSNATSQLFEPLLLRATGLNAHEYLAENILEPIGIDPATVGFWYDPTGVNPMTYCCLDMRPDDLARFGLLFARGGEWDGQQVLSSNYVDTSISSQSPFYGLQWWVLNSSFFGANVPVTVSAALGLDGQKIYIWPEEDVVVAVQTIYEHSANQGYVLSLTNWPNTCSARNTCDASTGNTVPEFDQFALIPLIYDLR